MTRNGCLNKRNNNNSTWVLCIDFACLLYSPFVTLRARPLEHGGGSTRDSRSPTDHCPFQTAESARMWHFGGRVRSVVAAIVSPTPEGPLGVSFPTQPARID
jgi:hypothetical protein